MAQNNNQKYITMLHDLTEVIDEMSEHIPDGVYLASMDKFKELFKHISGTSALNYGAIPAGMHPVPEQANQNLPPPVIQQEGNGEADGIEPPNPQPIQRDPPTLSQILSTVIDNQIQDLRRVSLKKKIKKKTELLSDADKLALRTPATRRHPAGTPIYKVCEYCNRLVKNETFKRHVKTDVCKRTYQTKKFTKTKLSPAEQALVHSIRAWAVKHNKPKFYPSTMVFKQSDLVGENSKIREKKRFLKCTKKLHPQDYEITKH